MRYFPLFADLDRANVLVVGGGEVAAQKIRLLRKTKARITVIAPGLNAELEALKHEGALLHIRRRRRTSTVKLSSMPQRGIASSRPACSGPRGPVAFRSMLWMRPSFPPSSP